MDRAPLVARLPIAFAAALALLLAPPARAEHYEEPVPLSLRDCTEHVGSFLVPRATVAPHMAPGFRFGYFPAELATLDPAERHANVILITVRCAERFVAGVPTRPAPDAVAVVVVEPPPSLARPGANFHAIGVHSLVDRGLVRFREWSRTAEPLGPVRLGADVLRHRDAFVELATAAGGRADAPTNRWRLFRTHHGRVLDAADVDASVAVDTLPGTAVLRSRGVLGLPSEATGIAIHEWDVDVDVTPLELSG